MEHTEFNNVEYNRILAAGYKFIELQAPGTEVETSNDYFKKTVLLIPHKSKPENIDHYVMDIDDYEVKDMLRGSDTDIFYVVRI